MGGWGAGLYQDDDAADLKELVSTLIDLPMPLDEVISHASSEEAAQSEVFWLVCADQVERKGLRHQATFDRARKIISEGSDIDRLKSLGMADADLRKRKKTLDELDRRLAAPRKEKPRKTLTSPKPLAVSAGDVVAYPRSEQGAKNPYFGPKLLAAQPFHPMGWAAFHVVGTGFAFGFLPWIAIQRFPGLFPERPKLKDLDGPLVARLLKRPPAGPVQFGTLSPSHMQKMEMTVIGRRPVPGSLNPDELERAGRAVAISDISIANRLLGA